MKEGILEVIAFWSINVDGGHLVYGLCLGDHDRRVTYDGFVRIKAYDLSVTHFSSITVTQLFDPIIRKSSITINVYHTVITPAT